MTTALDRRSGADPIVARVEKARALLAEARDATDAKKVADLAHAAEVYARRQRLSEEAIACATAVKVDAMTLMGEFLRAAPKQSGARGTGSNQHRKVESRTGTPPPTLAEVGIGRKESSDAQVLARVKQEKPELHAEIRAGRKKVSHARVEVKRQEKRAELKAKAAAATKSPSDWQVITGNAVEELGRLTRRPRLIFADPPYNVGVDYGDGAAADRLPGYEYLRWVGQWIDCCKSAVAPDGSLWVLINDEYAAEYALELKRSGFTVRSWVIWYETFGANCSDKFNRTKRHLFYTVNDPRRFVFHSNAVSRPSDRQVRYGDGRAAPGGKLLDDVWTDIPRLVGTAAERIPDFPTQLPLALLRRVVRCSTDPADLVVELFSGSATAGVAAVEAGRRYVGIEKSALFANLSRLRLKGVNRGDVTG